MRKKEKQLSSQYDKYFGRVIIFRKDIIFERENILKSDSIFLLRRDQVLCISVFMFFESVQANFLPGHCWSKVGRQADEYITRGVMFLCLLCIYVCLYERGKSIPILAATQWVTVKIGLNDLDPDLDRNKHRINPE